MNISQPEAPEAPEALATCVAAKNEPRRAATDNAARHVIGSCAVCGLPVALSPAPLVTYAEEIRIPPSISQPLRDLHLCGTCDETKRMLRIRNLSAAKDWRGLSKKVADETVRGFMDYLLGEFGFKLEDDDEKRSFDAQRKLAIAKVLTTSGQKFEGYSIADYRYYVSDEIVVGPTPARTTSGIVFADAEAQSLKKKLAQAKLAVLESLAGLAVDLGANAIIGLGVDYKTLGDTILVVGSGTAVVVARDDQNPALAA